MIIKKISSIVAFSLFSMLSTQVMANQEVVKNLLNCTMMSKQILQPHGVKFSKGYIKSTNSDGYTYKLKPILHLGENIDITRISEYAGDSGDQHLIMFVFKQPYDLLRNSFKQSYGVDLGNYLSMSSKKDKESDIYRSRHLKRTKNGQSVLLCVNSFGADYHKESDVFEINNY